jgi:hypothetical protein
MTDQQDQGQPELVWVFLSNGTGTSGGNGPGPVQVPPDEAAWLTGQRLGVYGTEAPIGFGASIVPAQGN